MGSNLGAGKRLISVNLCFHDYLDIEIVCYISLSHICYVLILSSVNVADSNKNWLKREKVKVVEHVGNLNEFCWMMSENKCLKPVKRR